MVPSAGSARPQLKRGLMSSALILRTVSSILTSLDWRAPPPAAGLAAIIGEPLAQVARSFEAGYPGGPLPQADCGVAECLHNVCCLEGGDAAMAIVAEQVAPAAAAAAH